MEMSSAPDTRNARTGPYLAPGGKRDGFGSSNFKGLEKEIVKIFSVAPQKQFASWHVSAGSASHRSLSIAGVTTYKGNALSILYKTGLNGRHAKPKSPDPS
jgi:hypothetical protein